MKEKKVKFTEMKGGDKEDYLLLKELEKPYVSMTMRELLKNYESKVQYH